MTAAEARELFTYDRWANAAVLQAAAKLPHEAFTRDMKSSFPSIQKTLVHVLGAEWIWLRRLTGSSPAALPPEWQLDTVGAIAARWRTIETDVLSYMEGLDDARMSDVVSYTNLRGDAFSSEVRQILRHLINHSTYHRGQVVTMLRQLGAAPPNTDLIAFHRLAAKPEPAR
jgi:uncharacterized damage-inducible protein DinB